MRRGTRGDGATLTGGVQGVNPDAGADAFAQFQIEIGRIGS